MLWFRTSSTLLRIQHLIRRRYCVGDDQVLFSIGSDHQLRGGNHRASDGQAALGLV